MGNIMQAVFGGLLALGAAEAVLMAARALPALPWNEAAYAAVVVGAVAWAWVTITKIRKG